MRLTAGLENSRYRHTISRALYSVARDFFDLRVAFLLEEVIFQICIFHKVLDILEFVVIDLKPRFFMFLN